MEAHQQRVVDEQKDLDEKREKLLSFIQNSPVFQGLGDSDRALLVEQYEVMTHYSVILQSRIDRF